MNGLHTEYSNLTPYHIQWLDGCGKLWKSGAPSSEGPTHLQFVQFGFEDEEWKFMIGHPGTHCPTGDAFCQGIAEILGIEYKSQTSSFWDHMPKEVAISKTETTIDHIPDIGEKVKPIKGMAIEVSKVPKNIQKELDQYHCDIDEFTWNSDAWMWVFYDSTKDEGLNFCTKDAECLEGLTITESPTEFLKYVKQQTGKEYKPMNNHQAVTSGTNDEILQGANWPHEIVDQTNQTLRIGEPGQLKLGGVWVDNPKPVPVRTMEEIENDSPFIAPLRQRDHLPVILHPHKIYRILDSLDGIPFDTRIPLSEWIPPFGVDVNFIHNGDFDRGNVHCIAKEGIIVKWRSLDCVFEPDGHWMRIV